MLCLFIADKNYSSWSLRPWILMKELCIPFEERLVPFGSIGGEPAFESFSPSGRVPRLIDADRTVWDSLRSLSIWRRSIPEFGRPNPTPELGLAASQRKCTRASTTSETFAT
jgi:glutathione S-transferase